MRMSIDTSEPTRRSFLATSAGASLATSAAAGAIGLIVDAPVASAQGTAIRPFRIETPEDALVDLRRRVQATRWPDRETVKDETQGVQFATVRKLADHWEKKYDWRKVEARLNALPQFLTEI